MYAPILTASSFIGALLAVALLEWMNPNVPPFWMLFRLVWQAAVVINMGIGLVGYAVSDVHKRLKEKNKQLEETVAKGTVVIEQQEQELTRAREIQEGLLPKELPQLPGVEIVSAWKPARSVGGDYFDVIRLDKKRLGICIGDVSGKSITAARLMANLQAAFRVFATPGASPAAVCARLNEFVCNNVAPGKFLTFFYGALDGQARALIYENVGHCPSLVMRASGQTELLRGEGAVLGVMPEWPYKHTVVQFKAGDRLLLYTDGVTEAENGQAEE